MKQQNENMPGVWHSKQLPRDGMSLTRLLLFELLETSIKKTNNLLETN